MNIRMGMAALLLVLGWAVGACGGGTMQPDAESNTNWLEMCTKDADCEGDSQCLCGTCTKRCDGESECGGVAKSAECVRTARLAEACGQDAPERICAVTCADEGDSACKGPLECRADRCVAPPGSTATPGSGPVCQSTSTVAEIAVTNVDRVDMLFVVDNSPEMAPVQSKLRDELPRLVEILTTGGRSEEGRTPFPPARDLHLAVVTADMGTPGVRGVPGCSALGDDGVFVDGPDGDVAGCQAPYPSFIQFQDSVDDPKMTGDRFGCYLERDGQGCSYAQPLEAGLKALWPSVDIDPNTGIPWVDPQTGRQSNRILFLDENGRPQARGHGDGKNQGFLRNDAFAGLSLISVVVVTNRDDCSSANTRHMMPGDQLSEDDPLLGQPEGLRCFFGQENLYRVERYVQGLQALRPGNENLVMFSAIAGVPTDLAVDGPGVDLSADPGREAYFDQLLANSRMQETIDNDAGALVPSCTNGDITAYPPRRLAQVAQGFESNGSIHSICSSDYSGAIDGIIDMTSRQLGAVCLPRPLPKQPDGLVDCNVYWELPPVNTAPASTPTTCDDEPFLRDVGRTTADGRVLCEVDQLLADSNDLLEDEGWYYDDSSEAVMIECPGNDQQRVTFTQLATPPTGVHVQLECADHKARGLGDGCDANDDCEEGLLCEGEMCVLPGGVCPQPTANTADNMGKACLPLLIPEDGFDQREAYVEVGNPACGGNACIVYELKGDPRPGCVPMTCPANDPSCRERVCSEPRDAENRIYCSCRCDAPGVDESALCDCADGFSCAPVSRQTAPNLDSYCVKTSTLNPS